jgi:hypothetical protein
VAGAHLLNLTQSVQFRLEAPGHFLSRLYLLPLLKNFFGLAADLRPDPFRALDQLPLEVKLFGLVFHHLAFDGFLKDTPSRQSEIKFERRSTCHSFPLRNDLVLDFFEFLLGPLARVIRFSEFLCSLFLFPLLFF